MALASLGLQYLIQLNDQISAPLKQIKGEIDRIGNAGKDAMMKIGAGAAGLVATGASLYSALQPAIEMSNALGNITATGMSDESLGKIEKFAVGFSSSFGVAAVEVVDSANEIIRAIDGLTDDEVIAFTRSSNLLSKATASSVKEMGSYLGTMYGIFKQEADKMGKAKWIEQMAGQATLTANMFKSSGESLSQAFTNLMSTGQSKGVALAEQFAVLGNLQSVMPGGMSGTKYGAFLKGVGKAQQKLGLQFLDSKKRMKPIVEILKEIKKAYGDTIDEVEALNLSKAFGSDDAVAVISYLLPKIDTLNNDIAKIGDVSNLDDAAKTAQIVTSVWDRLGNIFTNIRQAIGAPVLKKITPFFEKLADMGQSFVEWLQTYKNIARWLGYIVGGVIALTGFTAALTLFSGVFSAMGISLKVFGVLFKSLLGGLGIFLLKVGIIIYLVYKFRNEIGAFFSGVVRGFQATSRGFEPLFSALGSVWHSVQRVWAAFQRVFTAIFGSSDSLQTFGSIGETVGYVLGSAFNAFVSVLELIASLIEQVASIFEDVAQIIIVTWNDVLNAWGNGDYWGVFTSIGSGITGIFTRVLGGVKNMFFTFLNWLIDKVNGIGEYIGITIPKFKIEDTPEFVPDSVSAGSTVLQAMNATSLQSLRPKADSNGQVFSLGAAQPEKLQRSPNISKSMTTTNTYNYNTHIGAINTNKAEDAVRAIKEREQLS